MSREITRSAEQPGGYFPVMGSCGGSAGSGLRDPTEIGSKGVVICGSSFLKKCLDFRNT